MKKAFILTLLTISTLGLFKPMTTAHAAEVQLPSGTDRSQIGQKIEDFVNEVDEGILQSHHLVL